MTRFRSAWLFEESAMLVLTQHGQICNADLDLSSACPVFFNADLIFDSAWLGYSAWQHNY